MDEVGEAMIELLYLNIRQDRIYRQYTLYNIQAFSAGGGRDRHGHCRHISHCDFSRLHLLHKACWINSTLGSMMYMYVYVVPARIMHILDWGVVLQEG